MKVTTSRVLHLELTMEEAIALEISTSYNPTMDVNSPETEIVNDINEVLTKFIVEEN